MTNVRGAGVALGAAALFATAPALTQVADRLSDPAAVLAVRALLTIGAGVLLGRPRPLRLVRAALAGIGIVVGYYGATTLGYGLAPATVAAVGLASEPIVLVALAPGSVRSWRARLTVGVAASAIGLGGLGAPGLSARALAGLGLVAAGGAAFALAARILQAPSSPRELLRTTAFAQALGSVVLFALLAGTGSLALPHRALVWELVALLVAGSSLVGIALFAKAAAETPLVAAASLGLVTPLGGLAAWWLLGDPLNGVLVVAMLAAAAAVLLATTAEPRSS